MNLLTRTDFDDRAPVSEQIGLAVVPRLEDHMEPNGFAHLRGDESRVHGIAELERKLRVAVHGLGLTVLSELSLGVTG